VLNATAGSEGLLPPGSYKTIERKVANMVAALIPAAGAEGPVQIAGSTGGVTAFEHQP
jgi:hypothetical protein